MNTKQRQKIQAALEGLAERNDARAARRKQYREQMGEYYAKYRREYYAKYLKKDSNG